MTTMNLELTDEQMRLQEAAAEFAAASLGADMIGRDREAVFDRDAWRRCAEFGVLNMPIPQEYGGMSVGLTDLLAAMEGLWRGTRWYRTGDIVRGDASGEYVYLTRRDRMVKRRGYRIELGEIETGLMRHPDIREAAVVAVPDGESGVRIAAFVSCAGEQRWV